MGFFFVAATVAFGRGGLITRRRGKSELRLIGLLICHKRLLRVEMGNRLRGHESADGSRELSQVCEGHKAGRLAAGRSEL